jgi:DNA repair protein RadC
VRTTEQLRKAGELLDIELLDHIVVGQQRFVSLKQRGLGF